MGSLGVLCGKSQIYLDVYIAVTTSYETYMGGCLLGQQRERYGEIRGDEIFDFDT